MKRPCLDCGAVTSGSRCQRSRAERDNWRARRKIRSGWEWGKLRDRVHTRDRACVRCGSTDRLEVHHRVALVDGGGNTLGNLELRCHRCHATTIRDSDGERPRL